jgi:hypothetical protein
MGRRMVTNYITVMCLMKMKSGTGNVDTKIRGQFKHKLDFSLKINHISQNTYFSTNSPCTSIHRRHHVGTFIMPLTKKNVVVRTVIVA